MHDIWNPWHGCLKKSEGCTNCYMYFLDKQRGSEGSHIFRVKNNFEYPLLRDKDGHYKIKSGETLRVCMTSDFFLAEADKWRGEAWRIISMRPDIIFFLITKRPEHVTETLPSDWGDGWENVFLNVTCENQLRTDERVPLLLELPFKHKGIFVAPFIGAVSLKEYLKSGQIEQVVAGGENYDGSRVCRYEWVKNLYDECVSANVRFCFMETGTYFEKGGKTYHLSGKQLQSEMAYKSGLQFAGKKIQYKLHPADGQETLFGGEETYVRHFKERCNKCGSRLICNGCSDCGQCER